MGNFRRFSTIFQNFPQFFWNFLRFFWKIFPKFFAIFFDFCDSPTIFPENFSENFSENSRSQSVTVQPGSRHYCKFTIKLTSRITPKFTLILIKILQSTKFEGSHFHNLSQPFTTPYPFSQPCAHFPKLFPSLRFFPFAAVFSRL